MSYGDNDLFDRFIICLIGKRRYDATIDGVPSIYGGHQFTCGYCKKPMQLSGLYMHVKLCESGSIDDVKKEASWKRRVHRYKDKHQCTFDVAETRVLQQINNKKSAPTSTVSVVTEPSLKALPSTKSSPRSTKSSPRSTVSVESNEGSVVGARKKDATKSPISKVSPRKNRKGKRSTKNIFPDQACSKSQPSSPVSRVSTKTGKNTRVKKNVRMII